jgi:hypothetical protein
MPSKQRIQDNIDNIDILDLYANQQDKKKKSSGTKKQQQQVLISEDEIYRNPTSEKPVKSKNKTSGSKQQPQQKKSSGTKKQQQDILISEDEIYRNPTSDKPVKNNLYSSVYDGSWFIVLAAIGIPATIIGLMVAGTTRRK